MKSFEGYRLDTVNHCLWRGEERMSLAPKTFDVLRYLVEHADRLVTQDEILEALWPNTYVNPEVVKKYVLGIRKALGDDPAKPAFVATFPRRGYQFIAAVKDEEAPAAKNVFERPRRAIVGREEALAGLVQALERALAGKRQIVFVTGEAGIGKTTLIDAFEQAALSRARARFVRGHCVEGFGGKEAYYPLLDALGQLLGGTGDGAVFETIAARAPTWMVQFPYLVDARRREELEKQIVGATRERMVREICEALETITERSPLVLCIEDLHWVDPSTLDFLSAMARRRGSAKLLVVASYRPADVIVSQSPLKALKQDLLVHDLAREISLEHLEESDVARYLELEFRGGRFPEKFPSLIYRQSGGNALFMVAILEDLVKKRLVAKSNGAWSLAGQLGDIARNVPETLDQLIEVQFEQLGETEKRVLRAACVAGEHFSTWAIHNAAESAVADIETTCEALVGRQQFIRFAGIHALATGQISAHYDFIHSFYREVLYRRLPEVTRSKLHLLLAQRLKAFCDPCEQELATELALHFEGGHDYNEAIHYLMLAADNATRRFSYRDSIEILKQAQELAQKADPAGRDKIEVRILESIGDAHFALGGLLDSAEAYRAAALRAGQSGFRSAQIHALVRAMFPLGAIDPGQGLAAISQAFEMSKSVGDPHLVAHTQMLSTGCHLIFDDWRETDARLYTSAWNTLRDQGDFTFDPLQQMVHGHVLSLLGRYGEALAAFDGCVSRMEDPSTSLITSFGALSGKTFALLRSGNLGELLRLTRAGRESFEENRTRWWLLSVREAWMRVTVFDYRGAIEICEPLVAGSDQYRSVQPRAICAMASGYLAMGEQNFAAAAACFSEVHAPQVKTKYFLHWLWQMAAHFELGGLWLEAEDLARAKAVSASFLESALGTADPYTRALAWELSGRVALAARNFTLARERIDSALSVLEEYEVPLAAWRVYSTAAKIYSSGTGSKRAGHFLARARQAISKIADSFDRDEPLRASFLAAGAVRRACGKPPAARSSPQPA